MAGAAANRRKEESMLEFVERRAREHFDRTREGVREAAHDAYGLATRLGEPLDLQTPGDVVAFGTGLLNGHRAKPEPSTARSIRPPTPAPGERRTGGLASPAKAAPAQKKLAGDDWLDELNRNPYAKAAAGAAGMASGWIPGAYRGLQHMAEGVVDAGMFVGRALHPELDFAINPPGQRASDQVLQAGKAVIDYAGRVARDPDKPLRDARQFAHQVNVDLNPLATPSSDTATGEFNRLHDVGKNQGELALNIATLPAGGELAAISGVGKTARLAKAAGYLTKAGLDDAAEYLSLPYKGMGHHSVFARSDPMPKWLGGGKWPEWVVESPFNVVSFRHLSKGEAYAKHAMVDDHFSGAYLGRGKGVSGWSARKAGIETQSGLQRVWNGTPEATKDLGGAILGGVGGLSHEPLDGERSW